MKIAKLLGFRLSDAYPVWITLTGVFGGQVNLDAGKIFDVDRWGTQVKDCKDPTYVICNDGGVMVSETPAEVVAIIRKAVARG